MAPPLCLLGCLASADGLSVQEETWAAQADGQDYWYKGSGGIPVIGSELD